MPLRWLLAALWSLALLGTAHAATSTVYGVLYDAGDAHVLDSGDHQNVDFAGSSATMLSSGGYYELFGASFGGMTVEATATGYTSSSVAPYSVLGGGYSYELNFALTGTSPAVGLSSSGDLALVEGEAETISISADADTAYTISNLGSDLITLSETTVRTDGSGNGSFTVTAVDDEVWRGGGDEVAGILVYDESSGANSSITFSVTDEAGDEPDRVVVVIGASSVTEGSSTTGYVRLQAGDTPKQLDSGDVVVSLAITSGSGSLSAASRTISAGSSQSATFTITPTDNETDGANTSITVTPSASGFTAVSDSVSVPNDDTRPSASDHSDTTNEDTDILDGDVSAHVVDADGDTLTYAVDTDVANGTLSLNASNGTWTFSPDADWNGSDSFIFSVSDGTYSDTATVTITVNAVNDTPMASAGSASTDEDTAITDRPLPAPTDPDAGDTHTYAKASDAGHGSVSVAADGTFTYTPEADWSGEDSFTYTISDKVLATSSAATVTITVNAVNDDPVASDDAASVTEGDTVAIAVLDNDSDAEGDGLSIQEVGSSTHGTPVIDGTNISYTADKLQSSFTGTDSFTYTVSDGNGGTHSATVTVDIAGNRTVTIAVSDDSAVQVDAANGGDTQANASPDGDGVFSFPVADSDLYEALDSSFEFSSGEGG